VPDRGEHCWLRAIQLIGRRLEPSLGYDRVKAAELVKRQLGHYSVSILT
jgi:hypothetical protein